MSKMKVNREEMQQEHPFFNTLILENIFKCLSTDDIKKCRIVCKKWHEEAFKSLNDKQVRLRIGPGASETGRMSMSQLESCVSNLINTDAPFWRNLMFEECDISLDGLIWSQIGPQVKSLYFDRCKFVGEEPAGRVISRLVFEKTPNLESLVLNRSKPISAMQVLIQPEDLAKLNILEEQNRFPTHQNLKSVSIQGAIPTHLFILLPKAPKLVELRIGSYGTAKHTLVGFFHPFTHLARVSPFYELKALRHFDAMDTNIFDVMSQHGIPDVEPVKTFLPCLHTLCTKVSGLDSGFHSAVLGTYETTLRVLKLVSLEFRPKTTFTMFDRSLCTSLVEFHVWGVSLHNFDFLTKMPKLKILRISAFCYSLRDFHTAQQRLEQLLDNPDYLTDYVSLMVQRTNEEFCMPDLEEFETDFPFLKDDFEKLRKWMPNLRDFKTVLNTQTFRAVCQNWPQLHRLSLAYGSDVTDKAITGSKDKGSRFPNITDLKDLRMFELHTRCNKSKITDASVNEGFLKVPCLCSLKICVSPKLSKKAEQTLKASLKHPYHLEIYRNYGHEPGEAEWECCKQHLFQKKYCSAN